MLINMHQFLQSHDISMTTPSNLSTIMEMKRVPIFRDEFYQTIIRNYKLIKLGTTNKFCEMEQIINKIKKRK